jgi:hypothetical protein
MRRETVASLSKLRETTWFARCGEPLLNSRYILADNWKKALKLCQAATWRKLRLRLRGDLTAELSRSHRERFREWNNIVRELKPHIERFTLNFVQPFATSQGLPHGFSETVEWDVLNWYMEIEYSDLVSIVFYRDLMGVYDEGRFPCGWNGEYPIGTFVVF